MYQTNPYISYENASLPSSKGYPLKTKKPFYKKGWFLCAVLILLIAASMRLGPSDPGSFVSNEERYLDGIKISTNKFKIILNSVEPAAPEGRIYLSKEPSEGSLYIIVSWEYKNITKTCQTPSDYPLLYFTDMHGTRYDCDLDAASRYAAARNQTRTISDALKPGSRVKDIQIFAIPKNVFDAGGLFLQIIADEAVTVKVK